MDDLKKEKIDDFWTNQECLCIADPAPLVVLFGPATSGKTMALIRLSRLLINKGYCIVPDRAFRHDLGYDKVCDSFEKLLFSKYAARGTSGGEMILVKVIDPQGKVVCQYLDAPGPFFFDPNIPQEPWRKSIDYIRNLRNKHVWLFFVEPNWSDCETREMYVERITQMRSAMFLRDRTIFVSNKIDMHPHLFLSNGMPNNKQIFKNIKIDYPELYTPFENKNPITRLFRKYNSQLVPFSAGYFTLTSDGRQVYTSSNDFYPKSLWKAICAKIK